MDISFCTLKEGFYILEHMIKTREKLKDTSFYQDFAADCRKFADKLIAAGIKEEDITAMLEWETDKGCYYGILVK